jgi:predicted deacylase
MDKRDFEKVVNRVQSLKSKDLAHRVLAEVAGYPVLGVSVGEGRKRPTALLTGGVHGDEPAGVEAVLRFLEHDRDAWRDRLAFEVIPCLNPYGWVNNTRHNAEDLDLNWSYARDDVAEIKVIKDLARGRRFEFVVDFHEDWESPGFYLYELGRDRGPSAPEILRRVSAICPLNTAAEIEGQPAKGGLVTPDMSAVEKMRGQGIPLEMFYRYTDHLLTTETPTGLDMETRVNAHLAALETVLEAH